MLYREDAFEPLAGGSWDERVARRAIRAIAADAEAAFDADGLWPAHEWDAWTLPLPLTNLYVGAAGVVLALEALRRRGAAETRLDLAAAARRALAHWRERPGLPAGGDAPPGARSALLTGESGILLAAWRTAPDPAVADELHARVAGNAGSPANEVMWGAPGTMLAARAMLAWTGEERWAGAWRESAAELLARRDADGLWTQRLYGETMRELGPVHGLTGNVAALLDGGELLGDAGGANAGVGPSPADAGDDPSSAHARDGAEGPADEPGFVSRAALERGTAAVLARCAVVEDGLANWPMTAGGGLVAGDGEVRLQWCAGAPGIVASAAPYLEEELLLAGAELTWRAGAHGGEKGFGLCHGTAGNGHALLRAFGRTGDELWLDRARRFAMHALAQAERARERRGRGRHSLWTGDVGVALFASDCLDARARMPVLESWE